MPIDRHRCCDEMRLRTIGDCGSVTGFDLTLERCEACDAYVMDFFWAGSSTPNVMTRYTTGVLASYETVRDEVAACLEQMEAYEAPARRE